MIHFRLPTLIRGQYLKVVLLICGFSILSPAAQQTVDLGVYPGERRPHYETISTRSQYLKMDDGVRLAVDILLPKDLSSDTRLPTVVRWTRDGRASRSSEPTPLDLFFIEHGYARVLIDERGAGASFGVRNLGQRNLRDMSQVLDWIVARPWSNGKIGAVGDSRDGDAAELVAATGHAAVKAVASRYGDFDDLSANVMPGGIFAESLVNARNESARQRDDVKNFKPVDEDRGGEILKRAVRDHKAAPDLARLLARVTFRDDSIPELEILAGDLSVAAHKDAIERSGVAIYLQAGWLDGASAAGALRQFDELRNPQRLVIGPWNGGGAAAPNPASREESQPLTKLQQWSDLLAFFDHYLRNQAPPLGKRLVYYTMGEEKWKASDQWPPKGASKLRMRFSPDASLVSSGTTSGTVMYSSDPNTTTGVTNRWHPQLFPGVVRYPSLDEGRLSFTSGPFVESIDLTGTSLITMRIKSTTADAAFFAYLEVLPSFGMPRYVTEGQLRALHRKGSEFLKKDAEPLTPGEWSEITFAFLPHSVLVEKGDRIRVSVSGFDKETFARVPSNASSVWTVDCGASFVDLAGGVDSVEVMGTADYLQKNWATSFLLVRGSRGFRVFTLQWSGMKVGGWGQSDGFPAVRDYYPAADGSFVSAARENVPIARVRKRDNSVELVR